MRRSRLAVLAGAVAVAVALSACGGGGNTGGGSAGPAQLTGTGPITLATGKDTSGNMQKQVDSWNAAHPDEKVTIRELPESADAQRQLMVQNATARSKTYSVLNMDVIWTAEFAANGWIEQLDEKEFPLGKMLPPTVETGRYFGKLYTVPIYSDGGMLYYRKDLLDAAGVTRPPATWAELRSACAKVQARTKGIGCYAGQFDKYEGLTVNFSEAVDSAGGSVVKDGKAAVDSPAAKRGLDFLADGFREGYIPRDALTYKEEDGRRAFQAGKLIFHRQWPYQYAQANATDGSSRVAGKFAVAPLPGADGPGQSTLGGHDYGISKFAVNKKTALGFVQFMASEQRQRQNLEATSQAPTWASLYDDPALVEKFPYLPILEASILGAQERPEAVRYNDVSVAIQSEAYAALSGQKPTEQALKDLQARLEKLLR
ncbi:MAG TPA: ABC transporter substrate-binding protein [Mycobacteriales bacterium]|jgi:multiple sugar transport system substrate-binding protein|nr:ABC transporter substrate-binding protein [Mycobacteriales bacterium]